MARKHIISVPDDPGHRREITEAANRYMRSKLDIELGLEPVPSGISHIVSFSRFHGWRRVSRKMGTIEIETSSAGGNYVLEITGTGLLEPQAGYAAERINAYLSS